MVETTKDDTRWWYLKREDQVSHTGVMPSTLGEQEIYAEEPGESVIVASVLKRVAMQR